MSTVTIIRPGPAALAAANGGATLDLILELIRLRARRLVILMERAWQAGRTSPDQGLAIAPGEVERLLEADVVAGEEAEFAAADPALAALTARAAQAQAELTRDMLWSGLCRAFALGEAEADFLALLAAVEADPGLQRVVAYLHDDTRRDLPTPMLAARLAGRTCRTWRAPNLLRWKLALPADEAPAHALATGWRIDPAAMVALDHGRWGDPHLADAVQLVAPDESAAALPLQQTALDALEQAGELRDVELTGPPGAGRQTLAARFSAARRRPLIVANLTTLGAQGLASREAILRVLRQAAFGGAIAYFRDADEVPAVEWELARKLEVDFLRGARAPTGAAVAIPLAPLTVAERTALWRSLRAAPCPPEITAQRLTPAEIVRLALAPEAPRRSRRPDHHLLSKLACPYKWDDLVLPADTSRQLRELVDQIRLRWPVYDGWGFSRLTQMGCGIAALFGGPSGTGKTMAAQVIARSLNLDLYRVDLAGVVNKYVGETEKKLREVFDACEDSGALLFFDEADALFGGRMQVKDAHDRFANIEINYLLQRIETFDGVAILATNRREDIDEAFIRRLRFIVDFIPPQRDERMALWRRALQETSPSGEPLLDAIDWDLLAERLTMTGAAIKNTALSAAFLAHAEGGRIGMTHILHGARRELAKNHEKLPISLRQGDEP
jgi:MoxR-like ATPase